MQTDDIGKEMGYY